MYKHMCVDICSYSIDPLHRVKGYVRRAFCNCHRQPGARPGAASGVQPWRAGGVFCSPRAWWGVGPPFVPFELGGRSTILLDHAASALQLHARPLVIGLAMLFMLYGALQPWLSGSWRSSLTHAVFSGLKVAGLAIGLGYLAGVGPALLYQPGMLPFLFDKLVLSLALIVPLGALALVFLIGFGLLELIGVLMQPVMRPIWRPPGKSAIDAVASFVGSYSVGLLITDRMYRQGHYSVREAAIIATGFSTVSAPFMVIIAKTLGLMQVWNLYFWGAMLVTFAVTAVSARIYPLSRLPTENRPEPQLQAGEGRIGSAWPSPLR